MAEIFADRYEIVSEVGRGGFGIVYEAHDSQLLGRTVAVKVLHPALSADPVVVRTFQKEAGTLASLVHDHIVTVYDAGLWESRRYIVMQYLEGRSLAQVVAIEGSQSVERVREWLRQAASALAYAHGQGVLHRDVKSANLLLNRTGDRLYMTDFGLAQAVEASGGSSDVHTGTLTGTAAYRAPEVAKTGHTVASDLYSLGVVAYELLAGQLPFQARDPLSLMMLHATEPVPPLPSSVPADLATLIRRLLAKNPTERPADAGEVEKALSTGPGVPDGNSSGERGASNRTSEWRTWLKKVPRWVQVGSALALVALVVFGASRFWPHLLASPTPTDTPESIAFATSVPALNQTPPATKATRFPPAASATWVLAAVLSPTATRTPISPTGTSTTTAIATATSTATPTATFPPPPTPVPDPAFTVKEGTSVNVRSGPGTIYPVIGTLLPGETRKVTGRTTLGDWWQFDYDDRAGWVSEQAVSPNSQAASVVIVAAPPTPTRSLNQYRIIVARDAGAFVMRVPSGEIVTDLSREPVNSVELMPSGHILAVTGTAIKELDDQGNVVRQIGLPRAFTSHALPVGSQGMWVFSADDGTEDTIKYVEYMDWAGNVPVTTSGYHYPFEMRPRNNGNLLIVDGTGTMTEIDTGGNVVGKIGISNWADAICVLDDGTMLVGRPDGVAILDQTGQELRILRGGRVYSIDALPWGNFLIADSTGNDPFNELYTISEIDSAGNKVWSVPLEQTQGLVHIRFLGSP